jgi:hypothetical protein
MRNVANHQDVIVLCATNDVDARRGRHDATINMTWGLIISSALAN